MRGLMLFALVALLAGCSRDDADHTKAKRLIADNCAACHVVPGVRQAQGRVGPSLEGIASRALLAGQFPNERGNLVRWVAHSQEMKPGTAMIDTRLSPHEAEIVADYLETLD